MNNLRTDGNPTEGDIPPIRVRELKKGTIFLQLEERPESAYILFKRLLGMARESTSGDDVPGLVITRQFPPDLRKYHDLEGTPIYWLTTNISDVERTISPSTITKLNLTMSEFLKKEGPGIVVVDCIEYLITQNTFETVLRLLQSWNDKIVGTKKQAILSVDPLTLSIKQLHLIKRETQGLETGGPSSKEHNAR